VRRFLAVLRVLKECAFGKSDSNWRLPANALIEVGMAFTQFL
jgi:hypothetical protein